MTVGELYLFHPCDELCPAEDSLWGVPGESPDGEIYLESSSFDLETFRIWHRLPAGYAYHRLATRAELRDYFYNLSWFECRSATELSAD